MARFLVLESHHPTLAAMARLLREDGHEVVACALGEDALATVTTQRVDAVICDAGLARCEAVIRVRELWPQVCVAITTTEIPVVHHKHACLTVEKPIDYDALTAAIAHCLAPGACTGEQCYLHSPEYGRSLSLVRRRW